MGRGQSQVLAAPVPSLCVPPSRTPHPAFPRGDTSTLDPDIYQPRGPAGEQASPPAVANPTAARCSLGCTVWQGPGRGGRVPGLWAPDGVALELRVSIFSRSLLPSSLDKRA